MSENKDKIETLKALIISDDNPSSFKEYLEQMLVNNDMDALMMKFLKASQMDVESAYKKFLWLFKFRQVHHVDIILRHVLNNESYDNVRKNLSQGPHAYDIDGYPCYWVRFGQLNIPTLLTTTSITEVLFQLIQGMEYVNRVLFERQSNATHHTINKITLVVDLSGLSFSMFFGESRQCLSALTRAALSYFPELLHKMIIFNTGIAFSVGWSFAQLFIDPDTRDKIVILKNSNIQEFSKYISIEKIPKEYGGQCSCPNGCISDKDHLHAYETEEMKQYFYKSRDQYTKENGEEKWAYPVSKNTSDACSVVNSHDNQWKTIDLTQNKHSCEVLHKPIPQVSKPILDLIPEIQSIW
ncbi:hypothetical protein WA158_002862 [Blastocystis sp. Blastoise]